MDLRLRHIVCLQTNIPITDSQSPLRGQVSSAYRAGEGSPGSFQLLEVSAEGRVRGYSLGSGQDGEEAYPGALSERGKQTQGA